MNISKKLSWHAAAIAAALVFSGAANADNRDHGQRGHGQRDNGHGNQWDGGHHSRGYDQHYRGNDHRRAWRDNGRHDYRYYDRGYNHGRYPRGGYNGRHYAYPPQRRYYGQDSYYYGVGMPVSDYGATLTFQIPLR